MRGVNEDRRVGTQALEAARDRGLGEAVADTCDVEGVASVGAEEGLHSGESGGRVVGLVLAEERNEDALVGAAQAAQNELLAAHGDSRLGDGELGALAGHPGLGVHGALEEDLHGVGLLQADDRDVLVRAGVEALVVRARLDNTGLLLSDLREGLPQPVHVVHADRRDDGDVRVDDVRGVPGAAHADLDDGDVDGSVREGREGQRHEDFELAHRGLPGELVVDHRHVRGDLLPDAYEVARGNGIAVDDDALGHPAQCWRGEQAGAAVEGAQERIRKTSG